MTQKNRLIIGIVVVLAIIGVVLGVDQVQRRSQGIPELPAGAIPIYMNGDFIAGFVPDDLGQLKEVSFVDDEEGKKQDGWLLRDVLLLYVNEGNLKPETRIVVSSSSRQKFVELTWAEVNDRENMVMFDVSGRGTLKLISKSIDELDVRDEWVQEVDFIEIFDS
jgi:hypothetical protein